MYHNYYGNIVPDYRYANEERFALLPITAGILGLGLGYFGGLATPRPCCYPPYGPGFGGYGGFGGFGGYGYPPIGQPGYPFYGGPGFY